jgi:hypothetical protein
MFHKSQYKKKVSTSVSLDPISIGIAKIPSNLSKMEQIDLHKH